MEVLIAVAVGGVLTILTICLIIIYVLVSRDSWCSCLRHHQHRQGSDISELGRSVIIKCIVGRLYIQYPCFCNHCSRRTVLFPFYLGLHFTSEHCQ